MLSLEGRWVLVTGSSRGIGSQIARFMASQGCNLILHSRNLDHTEDLLQEVIDHGVEAYSVEADLADASQVHVMLDEIEERELEVDVLFNNAGVQVAYRKDYWKTPIEDFETSFQVNTIAPAMICYRLIPPMIERGFGRVINVTSGISNEPQQAGYSTSKAALDKFTNDLASETDGSNVLINLADPGWCKTDMGGYMAPSDPESSLPGMVIGAFVNDQKSGRLFRAMEYTGMTLEQAVIEAEATPNLHAFRKRSQSQ